MFRDYSEYISYDAYPISQDDLPAARVEYELFAFGISFRFRSIAHGIY